MNQLSRISRDFISDMFKDMSAQSQIIKPFYNMSLPESINIDITESPEAFSVQAELPGVKKEDINVTIDNRELKISVETREEKDEKKDEKIIMSERYFGYVSRTITLPADVKQSEVDAHYKDGILSLTLPKAAGQLSNRISIN